MKLLACNSNRTLSQEIASYLGLKLINAEVKKFADMEVFVEIKENVRGEDIFVIQSTSYPANDNIMELLIAIDALRRSANWVVVGSSVVFRAACERWAPGAPLQIEDGAKALY